MWVSIGSRIALLNLTRPPLYCREFPLEYDGDSFALNELDCPGVGVGSMTKEELLQIREDARLTFSELRRIADLIANFEPNHLTERTQCIF